MIPPRPVATASGASTTPASPSSTAPLSSPVPPSPTRPPSSGTSRPRSCTISTPAPSTKEVILGTESRQIFEMAVDEADKGEKYMKLFFELTELREGIKDLQMETAVVGNATRFYVMAVTPMRLYSFTSIGSLKTVFASYSDRAIHFMELPGEIPNSELHFFVKQRRAKHFGWLSGVGIYHDIDLQIKQLNVPIKVKIFEWNAGGLLSRIEGLRAFLPKPEMMTRLRNFTDLKNSVGQQIQVCITRIDEMTNELIISEKEAWAIKYLRKGTLLRGTVRKLFPYGAQIRIGETNRGGLLHISNITHGQLTFVGDVLKVDEIVKALVIKSPA